MKNLEYDWQKISANTNGHSRYVVHFSVLAPEYPLHHNTDEAYAVASKRANKIGGRRHNTKSHPYHLVFQSFNLQRTEGVIREIRSRVITGNDPRALLGLLD